jgi:hypothetical protein
METIRPAVQALIAAGNVEFDEVENLTPPCNLVEARALIPAWTDSSFARALDRALVHLKLGPPPTTPWWALYQLLQSIQKDIERPISQAFARQLAQTLASAMDAANGPPPNSTGYIVTVWDLANEAQKRLAAWPATTPPQE